MKPIYQDQLLALARHARKQTNIPLIAPTYTAEVNNPVCGDRVRASVIVENNIIVEAHAEAKGCALCEAGTGLWLNSVLNHTMSSLPGYHSALANWLVGQEDQFNDIVFPDGLDSFAPVRAIKNRHKCVTLAFSTAGRFEKVLKTCS